MSLSTIKAKYDYAKDSKLQEKYGSLENYLAAKKDEHKQKVSNDLKLRLAKATVYLDQKRTEFDLSKVTVFNAKKENKINTIKYADQAETSLYAQNVLTRSGNDVTEANINNNVAFSSLQNATDAYASAMRGSMLA
jgi:hypothetical protein